MINNLLIDVGAIVGIVVAIVVVVLAIIVVSWYINTRNNFVKMKNRVEEAWASIDVYLKKRFDLIPNLVETVKGFASHESETLEKVVQARNIALNASTAEEKMQAANAMTGSLKTLFHVVSENYPQLQANANFLDLQNQLKLIEQDLENARLYYNGQVKGFNTAIELFPANLVVQGMGEDYKKRPYFELDSEEERQNVRVQF
ncbi:MAG: LemA family protein [Clostridia bacterium]|nr:LemA family protein [Clostridia bacterium]